LPVDWRVGVRWRGLDGQGELMAGQRGGGSPPPLDHAIGRFCQGWNERCQPFTWTKPADEILAKLNRQNTSATSH